MRVLVTIPHFFNPAGDGAYGSLGQDPQPRIWALTQCLRSLRALYDSPQELWMRHQDRLQALPANQNTAIELDIVLCTTQRHHVLDHIPFPEQLYQHHPTQCESMLLGFECHAVLAERLGDYDLYAYMEDDLILHDPYFFAKLGWFSALAGDDLALLQPNRFEFAYTDRAVRKVYIDFEFASAAARRSDTVAEQTIAAEALGQTLHFQPTSNPHAASFFLNQAQMAHWAGQDHFLSRDSSFVGPLESAASLGLIRTFRVYKPAPPNANFLEIQHYGQAWSRRLHQVRIGPA